MTRATGLPGRDPRKSPPSKSSPKAGLKLDRAAASGTAARKGSPMPKVSVKAYRSFLRSAPLSGRIQLEREGVPAKVVRELMEGLGRSTSDLLVLTRIPKATLTKKLRESEPIAGMPGQSVVGLMELVNRVEDMLAAEQDNPQAAGFNVERWVGEWIQRPQPALGGLKPAELMDTQAGRESVMRVLGSIQSGAYQ